METDYVIRSSRRTAGGNVAFVVVDTYGEVFSIAVPFRYSDGELRDRAIRAGIARYRDMRLKNKGTHDSEF